MKFVCNTQPYRQYWGYVFYKGKPVEVVDRATIERCSRDSDFEPYEENDDAMRQEEGQAATTPVLNTVMTERLPYIDPDACKKCGKVFRQGKWLHAKYCKG